MKKSKIKIASGFIQHEDMDILISTFGPLSARVTLSQKENDVTIIRQCIPKLIEELQKLI